MRKRMLLLIASLLMIGASFSFAGGQKEAAGASKGQPVFATVVKSIAFNWFKRMGTGIQEFGTKYDVKAFMQGPSQADSSQQINIIQGLIAQHPAAIMNDPYGVEQQEAVQKQAMDARIVVVTMEAADVKYANCDVEAFDNKAYGVEMMKQLAQRMGGKGKYIQFVGALSNDSHMTWVNAAEAYQKEHYPDMQLIGRFESKEDVNTAYKITKDVLQSHPDLKGIEGSGATDVVGAGRAVQEAGLDGKIAVVGTSIPSYAGDLLKSGAISLAMAWDPAAQGYAANVVAYKVLKGEKITDGMDLGVPGYDHITLVTNSNGVPVVYGSAWIEFTAANMSQYPF